MVALVDAAEDTAPVLRVPAGRSFGIPPAKRPPSCGGPAPPARIDPPLLDISTPEDEGPLDAEFFGAKTCVQNPCSYHVSMRTLNHRLRLVDSYCLLELGTLLDLAQQRVRGCRRRCRRNGRRWGRDRGWRWHSNCRKRTNDARNESILLLLTS